MQRLAMSKHVRIVNTFAMVTSSVASSLFQGTGSAETFSDVDFSAGSSKFDVTFSLSTPTQVDLTGELVFEDDAFASITFVSKLSDGSSTIFAGEDDPFFFGDQSGLPCEDAADANDDGALSVEDPLATLQFLFLQGAVIKAPGVGHPWLDPTPDSLGCRE